MRASNLSLVIATGYYLLWAVRAQALTSIQVQPRVLIPNRDYNVTWDDGSQQCFIAGVYLMELGPDNTPTSTFHTLIPTTQCFSGASFSCTLMPVDSFVQFATDIAPSNLDPSKLYEVSIVYATAPNATDSLQGTTGLPLHVTSIESSSISSSNSMSSADSLLSLNPAHLSPSSTSATASPGGNSPNTTPVSTPTATSSATSSPAVPGTANESSGLSTGAKVGIAIGAVGFALLVLIAALLIWRRSRQRQLRALPNGMPYSHDIGSTNRDFTAEKDMHVISSPVDTLHNGYSSIPPVAETQSRSPRGSYPLPDDHAATDAVPYTDAHRGSYGSGYEDSASPVQESQAHMPPAAAAGAAIQRKPVGAASAPTHHLREPGMSDEEVARLEEEERRLDEAIAEAERRRQLQG